MLNKLIIDKMSLIIADNFQPNSGSDLTLDGNVLVVGNLSAGTIVGNSSTLTSPISIIIPEGSGVTSVNSYLEYGINLLSAATVTDFCVRLPQIPIEGREVIVINKSGFDVFVYPSMSAGTINGGLTATVIPPDNLAYTFICYENPNPGSWSTINVAAATGQYDSGIISIDTSLGYGTGVVSAYDDNFKHNAVAFYSSTVAYQSLNQPYVLYNPNPLSLGIYSAFGMTVYFKPVVPWSFIDKVTVYTNFTSGLTNPGSFRLVEGYEQCYYYAGTTTATGVEQNGGANSAGNPTYTDYLVGTPNLSSGGFTATPGEPGTWYGELVYNINDRPYNVGDVLLSSGTFSLGMPVNAVVNADLYSSKYVGFIFDTNQNSPNVKFRFIIDYTI